VEAATKDSVHGDFEAMVSAVTFAAGVIIMTRLVEKHTPFEVSGASLLISGLILVAILVLLKTQVSTPSFPRLIYLITFSLFPLFAALLYATGLNRIGASLTSTIASSNILLTIFLQLVLKGFGIKANLPENIRLAIPGGAMGLVGIYLIHTEKDILFHRV
jgi:drug/metabolite transporter (DMT)-like permease